MPQAQLKTKVQATLKRRSFLGAGAIGLGAICMWPEVQTFAADAQDFLMGPPVKDIPPTQVSKHVWMIFAPDGFPTQENRGMMSNVSFVVFEGACVRAIVDVGNSVGHSDVTNIGHFVLNYLHAQICIGVSASVMVHDKVDVANLDFLAVRHNAVGCHCFGPSCRLIGPALHQNTPSISFYAFDSLYGL